MTMLIIHHHHPWIFTPSREKLQEATHWHKGPQGVYPTTGGERGPATSGAVAGSAHRVRQHGSTAWGSHGTGGGQMEGEILGFAFGAFLGECLRRMNRRWVVSHSKPSRIAPQKMIARTIAEWWVFPNLCPRSTGWAHRDRDGRKIVWLEED